MAEGGDDNSDRGLNLTQCNERQAEGEDREDQINELIALKAIYENEELELCEHDNPRGDMPGGIFNIPIFPLQPFNVKITKDPQGIRRLAFWRLSHHSEAVGGRGRLGQQVHKPYHHNLRRHQEKTNQEQSDAKPLQDAESEKLYPVKRLPPIVLTFAFPHNYPSVASPVFSLSCCWLEKKHLSFLCEKLDEIWSQYQGSPIIMNWVTFLQEDLIDTLEIQSPYDLGRVLTHVFTHPVKDTEHYQPTLKRKPFDLRGFQTFGTIDDVLPAVLDFNLSTCEICFEEKPGSEFLRLITCEDHQQCKDCARGWFQEQINAGAVHELTCPGFECKKSVLPTEVAAVVSPELYKRYDKLLLKTAFDLMHDVSACPRPFCQFPVVLEDNLGLCPKCKHAFCGRCQNTYHGLTPCKLKKDMFTTLCDEYENCSESRRLELEMRYGKQMIRKALDETHSERWLKSNSKQCPSCGTYIQRKEGCNKMTCTSCRAFFCWLCEQELSRTNPYAHYQHPTSPCANKLFQGVDFNSEFPDFLAEDDDWSDDDDSDGEYIDVDGL